MPRPLTEYKIRFRHSMAKQNRPLIRRNPGNIWLSNLLIHPLHFTHFDKMCEARPVSAVHRGWRDLPSPLDSHS